MKKYLPSKKILKIFVPFLIVLIIILLSLFIKKNKEKFENKTQVNKLKTVENKTILEIIKGDTDGDSILDWEETLWGTDKNKGNTFGALSDADYIKNKKKELNIIEKNIENEELNETDKFARQFFATYVALKNSNEVDPNTLADFTNSIEQRLTNSNLEDIFTVENVITDNDNTMENKVSYYNKTKNLFEKHEKLGVGDELSILTDSYSVDDETKKETIKIKLFNIANEYKKFADSLIKIKVPSDLTEFHLKIANSANNLNISITNMAKSIDDPILGLSGTAQYEKYNKILITTVGELEEYLSKSGNTSENE